MEFLVCHTEFSSHISYVTSFLYMRRTEMCSSPTGKNTGPEVLKLGGWSWLYDFWVRRKSLSWKTFNHQKELVALSQESGLFQLQVIETYHELLYLLAHKMDGNICCYLQNEQYQCLKHSVKSLLSVSPTLVFLGNSHPPGSSSMTFSVLFVFFVELTTNMKNWWTTWDKQGIHCVVTLEVSPPNP